MKIIIVDDQPQLLAAYTHLFEGHDIRLAFNAKEAGHWYESGFIPDFVISDWDMPALTGGDLCRLMRLGGYTGPFFIVSGESRHGELTTCGATDCYVKPLTRDDITAILSRCQRT